MGRLKQFKNLFKEEEHFLFLSFPKNLRKI